MGAGWERGGTAAAAAAGGPGAAAGAGGGGPRRVPLEGRDTPPGRRRPAGSAARNRRGDRHGVRSAPLLPLSPPGWSRSAPSPLPQFRSDPTSPVLVRSRERLKGRWGRGATEGDPAQPIRHCALSAALLRFSSPPEPSARWEPQHRDQWARLATILQVPSEQWGN